jgi:hypothetical protein
VLLGLLGAVILLLLTRILYALLGRRRTRKTQAEEGGAEAELTLATPRGLQSEAVALAERGEYGEAARCLYRAALLGLDRRGLVVYRPSYTNHEYLHALREYPQEAEALRPLARQVALYHYGGRPLSGADWKISRDCFQRLWESERAS